MLEEHVPRGDHGVTNLLAGAALTLFSGIVVAHDRVLLAAGSRGLFVLPKTLTRDVVVLSALGEVHDVCRFGERIFALTTGADGAHALVELTFAEGVFTEAARTALPARFNRLVD